MRSPIFQGVFFDLDGTLLDTTPLIIKSFQHAFQTHFHREINLADIQPYMGKPLRAAMEVMAPGEEDAVIATYRSFNNIHHDQLAGIFEGVHDTVKTLHDAGIALAIVTSKTSTMARRGLRLFNIEQYFTAVIGVDESVRHKPEPEPVLTAIRQTGLTAAECIMIGDSAHDILSGQGAGVKTAAVRWSEASWSEVLAANPDYILETMPDLLEIVFKKES
ncbi:MAG: ppaX [Firmicutes bacterium]|nr:ppaX [Bacillota bacterium]